MFKLKTLTKLFNKLIKSFGKLLTKRNIIVFALFILLYVMSSSFDLFEGIANKLQDTKTKNKKLTVHTMPGNPKSSNLSKQNNTHLLKAKKASARDICLGKSIQDCPGTDYSNIKTTPFIDTGCIAADGHKLKAKDDNDCARQKTIHKDKKLTHATNKHD